MKTTIKISRSPIGWTAVMRSTENNQVQLATGEGINPHEAIGVCICNARYATDMQISFNNDPYTQVYLSVNGMQDVI